MSKSLPKTLATLAASATFAVSAGLSQAADWSTTEVQLQYGDLQKAFQGGGSASETGGTTITTFQHASGWEYGDNFFFFDVLNYGTTDAEAGAAGGDDETYGEFYSNFSLGKITGNDLSFAFVRDIGLIMGFNYASEVDNVYYLPGVRFALNLPGFAFANLDVTAYIPNGTSTAAGGTTEDDSFMVDFNWAYPFKIGSTSWSIEGHIEYIEGADTVSGLFGPGERESWILAQPQIRLDLGEAIGGKAERLFVGLEFQYWDNKLGDKMTDESEVQLLGVWRL